jgi:hypothetical protein
MQLMYRSSWRFALWNVQGIQSRPSHTLVSNFINSLHINAAVLTLTNLSFSSNPPGRHWPAAHWITTTPSRGSGVAVVVPSRSRPPRTVAMASTPHPHFTPWKCTLSALSTCEDSYGGSTQRLSLSTETVISELTVLPALSPNPLAHILRQCSSPPALHFSLSQGHMAVVPHTLKQEVACLSALHDAEILTSFRNTWDIIYRILPRNSTVYKQPQTARKL